MKDRKIRILLLLLVIVIVGLTITIMAKSYYSDPSISRPPSDCIPGPGCKRYPGDLIFNKDEASVRGYFVMNWYEYASPLCFKVDNPSPISYIYKGETSEWDNFCISNRSDELVKRITSIAEPVLKQSITPREIPSFTGLRSVGCTVSTPVNITITNFTQNFLSYRDAEYDNQQATLVSLNSPKDLTFSACPEDFYL